MYQNKLLNHMSTKLPKFFSVLSWKLNTSLTQKDTMDRGAWIKIQKERHAGGLICKGQKSKSTKSAKWHGNEEQMNISVYHMSQFCGVQTGSYLKIEVTMKFIFQPQKSYLDLEILVSTLPNRTIINDLSYISLLFEKSI